MNEVLDALEKAKQEAFQKGYAEGCSSGYQDGYDIGWEAGYGSGYDDGLDETGEPDVTELCVIIREWWRSGRTFDRQELLDLIEDLKESVI